MFGAKNALRRVVDAFRRSFIPPPPQVNVADVKLPNAGSIFQLELATLGLATFCDNLAATCCHTPDCPLTFNH